VPLKPAFTDYCAQRRTDPRLTEACTDDHPRNGTTDIITIAPIQRHPPLAGQSHPPNPHYAFFVQASLGITFSPPQPTRPATP